ncbi:hypothetical protein BSLG_006093 [Batrachochytrium salamandrivorans]|nr:hypothetical protein BASA83_011828 [Batrachochytrium salamandrivorans]KAJ1338954.1 hypothetical protein BSLG_006093 [Batrachochytrium salamandrivorans]
MKCFTFLALCWLALSSQAVNIPHSHDAQYDAQYDTANSASDVQQDGSLDEQGGSLDEPVQSVSLPAESLVQVSEEGESEEEKSEEEDPEEGVSGKRVSEEEEFEEEELEEEVFEEEVSEEGEPSELLRELNEELAVAQKSRNTVAKVLLYLIDEYKYTQEKWSFITAAYYNSATRTSSNRKKDHSQQALHMKAIYNSVREKKWKLEQRLKKANLFRFVAARQVERIKTKIDRVKNHKEDTHEIFPSETSGF